MIIFEKRQPTLHEIIYSNIQLKIVDFFNYLGINLYKNTCWLRNSKRTAYHFVYAFHNLCIVFNQITLNANDKCNLFDS